MFWLLYNFGCLLQNGVIESVLLASHLRQCDATFSVFFHGQFSILTTLSNNFLFTPNLVSKPVVD